METSLESPKNISANERIKLVFKFALVAFVFWLLFKKGLVTWESIQKVISNPGTLILCVLLVVLNTVFGTVRWMLLLKGHGANLSFMETLRFNLVGSFFNIALPGAVSGDVIKAIYIAKKHKEKRSAIFGSILFDRVLGVSALVLVASVSTFLGSHVSWGASLPGFLTAAIYASGLGVAAFYVFLLISKKFDPFEKFFKRLTKLNAKLEVFEKIYWGVVHYRNVFGSVMKGLVLSVLIHLLIITVAFMLANLLAEAPIPFIALAVVVPIGLLATAIPVLPAGVGTGHAAFYFLFKLVSSQQGAEIFSWLVLFQIFIGALGGIVYLRTKIHQ